MKYTQFYPSQMRLGLHYVGKPTAKITDVDVTKVPMQFKMQPRACNF